MQQPIKSVIILTDANKKKLENIFTPSLGINCTVRSKELVTYIFQHGSRVIVVSHSPYSIVIAS